MPKTCATSNHLPWTGYISFQLLIVKLRAKIPKKHDKGLKTLEGQLRCSCCSGMSSMQWGWLQRALEWNMAEVTGALDGGKQVEDDSIVV
jgi:hypothetical protein